MNVNDIKKDFPILSRKIDGTDLVYLDNAATAQKPQAMLDALLDYYTMHNANVHRGIHTLSEEATEMYENARKVVAEFIGASHTEEIIFTKGTTEALNRVAICWGLVNLKKDDIILLSDMEHHSNLVPWQKEAEQVGAKIELLESNTGGEITLDEIKKKIRPGVKVVSVTHASNVLGTILPVREICRLAHDVGAVVCVDGAQAVPHLKVNVKNLDCDFYAFSGHKMLGPTGIGVLWTRRELLEKMDLYEYGGGMIDEVTYTNATWAALPERFEAGTPNVAGAIGLAAACNYLKSIGMNEIRKHEIELNGYALQELGKVPNLKIMGPLDAEKRTGLVAFYFAAPSSVVLPQDVEQRKMTAGHIHFDTIHSHDVAAVLNQSGIAVRSGHHCAMPLHKKLNIAASTRASYYLYNSKEDIDKLREGLNKAVQILG